MAVRNRLKISACLNSLNSEIGRLENFNAQNQTKFGLGQLSRPQIELMVESVFFSAFRAYENFIREIFILYCLEKTTPSKGTIRSYLKPKNFEHSEQLLKSSMSFLDWNSPDTIIERAETYLENGYPIKLPYTTNLHSLRNFKKLRNHIAHDSVESEDKYINLVRSYYGYIPLSIPKPGAYLMLTSPTTPSNNLLLDFFDLVKQISVDLT